MGAFPSAREETYQICAPDLSDMACLRFAALGLSTEMGVWSASGDGLRTRPRCKREGLSHYQLWSLMPTRQRIYASQQWGGTRHTNFCRRGW